MTEDRSLFVLPAWVKTAISVSTASIPAELITLPICTMRINYAASVILNEKRNIVYPVRLHHLAQNIYNSRGLYGFFNSSPMAILSQVVSATSKYTIYDFLKRHFGTTQNDWMVNSGFGAIAGVTGAFITQPIDRVKTLRQYDDGKPTRSYG